MTGCELLHRCKRLVQEPLGNSWMIQNNFCWWWQKTWIALLIWDIEIPFEKKEKQAMLFQRPLEKIVSNMQISLWSIFFTGVTFHVHSFSAYKVWVIENWNAIWLFINQKFTIFAQYSCNLVKITTSWLGNIAWIWAQLNQNYECFTSSKLFGFPIFYYP